MAEEIVSDVYLAAWRRRSDLPDPALPWPIRTADNSLKNYWRGRHRQERLAAQLSCLRLLAAEDMAVDRQRTLTALENLTETDREALLLVGWDGLSHAEAADILGCNPAAFTARLQRARSRFNAQLDETRTLALVKDSQHV